MNTQNETEQNSEIKQEANAQPENSSSNQALPPTPAPADETTETHTQQANPDNQAAPANPVNSDNHVTEIVDGDRIYHIIGTAHVSEASRQEVARIIQGLKPDKVCVELCQERYDSYYDTDRWKKLNIFDVIRKGKFLYLLANLAISAYQRKMGALLGVKPGAELIGAAEEGQKVGADVVLIDRNIHITLKRVWGNLGFWTKSQMLGAIVASLFENDEASKDETSKEIENLKKDANLSSMMEAMAEEFPQVHKPLIDERDHYLVAKMRECGGKNVVAVVGAGHVQGMKRYFKDEIDTAELNQLPKPSKIWTAIKWLIPIILLGGIAYGLYSNGFDSLREMLVAWVLPNSLFCFLAAIIALAHPLTILCAIIVSPITSTTPVIGAGIVLGLLEAWLRKPTVADCEDLPNVHSLRDFYKNSFTHVLIVCVLTTFGSALGAWIGIGWLLKIIGIDG